MKKETGPGCPGCGYPIFGLRDMRCPECGRKLDVRDFALGGEGMAAARRKLRRDGIIGGLIAVALVGIVILPVLSLTGLFASYGVMPGGLVLLAVFGLVWFGRVFRGVARDVIGDRKWKKREGD